MVLLTFGRSVEFLRTFYSVGSVDLIISFANAQNWVLQPMTIPAICILPRFRSELGSLLISLQPMLCNLPL